MPRHATHAAPRNTSCRVPGLPATMQAVLTRGPSPRGVSDGDWSFYVTDDAPTPPCPEADEVQVLVRGSSVNPSDWYEALQRSAHEQFDGAPGLGQDLSGVVVAVGSSCDGSRLRVGDEVWGMTSSGLGDFRREQNSYAQFANTYCWAVARRPPTARDSLEELGVLGNAGSTAMQALRDSGAPWPASRNVTVVVTSGSGGTGVFAVQQARALGAARVATAASPRHFALLRSLGASLVVDYRVGRGLWDVLPPRSVDVVFDNYGAEGTAALAAPALRGGGVYISMAVGHFSPWQARGVGVGILPPLAALGAALPPPPGTRTRDDVTLRAIGDRAAHAPDVLRRMDVLVAAGALRAVVGSRYGLSQLAAAFAESIGGGGGGGGKIGISVPLPRGWSPHGSPAAAIEGWPPTASLR